MEILLWKKRPVMRGELPERESSFEEVEVSDLICPYCDEEAREPDECNEQDYGYEYQCDNCHKNFIFYVDYIKTYRAKKADCQNGGEHDYKMTHTYPEEFRQLECQMCGDLKSVEVEAIIPPQ